MDTKLERVVIYDEGVPPITLYDPLITWSCNITRQSKATLLWPPKLEGWCHKVRQHSDNVVLRSHVTNENYYISTTRVPMAIILDRMLTYLDGLLPITSLGFLIT